MNNFELRLFHGRNRPEEKLPGWGFDGPTIPCVGIGWTYGRLRVYFEDSEQCAQWERVTGWDRMDDCLWVDVREDLIFTQGEDQVGRFYGDFSLHERG